MFVFFVATTTWYDAMTETTTTDPSMNTSLSLSSSLCNSTSSFHQMAYRYGIQIIVLMTLIAITIFRKEMSCNHCYSAPPPPAEPSPSQQQEHGTTTTTADQCTASTSSSTASTKIIIKLLHDEMDHVKTESLLEEAGCYGSGTYTLFLNTIRLLQRFFLVFRPNENTCYYYNYYSCCHPFVLLHYHMWGSIALWWNVAAEERRLEDILDGADNWCVLGPQPSSTLTSSDSALLVANSSSNSNNTKIILDTSGIFPGCTASQHLPNDVLVQIFSYLHPQDIISFSCTNRNIHYALLISQPHVDERDVHDSLQVHDNDRTSKHHHHHHHHELSHAIWKTVWYRDYGWLVTQWEVGRMALERSFAQQSCRSEYEHLTATRTTVPTTATTNSLDTISYSAKFYFRFGMSYVNYLIAGHSNRHQCFIGLGGHIYDITKFVDHHPGSSETLLVHSGRDVSSIFETMRHTVSARIMAEQFCVVVDTSLLPEGVGARPTRLLLRQVGTLISDNIVSPVSTPAVSHRCHSNRPIPSTLEYLYDTFIEEHEIYERQVEVLLATLPPDTVVGEIHVYYDPMIDEWRGWYMNTNFESVFTDL